MIQRLPAAALAALLLAAAPAGAEQAGYGEAFVAAFAEACVPERLSYPGTTGQAQAAGWTVVAPDAHPELASLLTRLEQVARQAAEEMDATLEYGLYGRNVAGTPHHLIVSRSSFAMDFGDPDDAPEIWTYIGCYLYNFDAAEPIDPAPMSALTGNPVARQVDDNGLVSYTWGPPCLMPRTGDSYLTFIATGSPHAETAGFSGLMVKFETSEPDPGEEVPETYCTDAAASGET